MEEKTKKIIRTICDYLQEKVEENQCPAQEELIELLKLCEPNVVFPKFQYTQIHAEDILEELKARGFENSNIFVHFEKLTGEYKIYIICA